MGYRLGEAVLRTCFRYGPIAMEEPDNYEARANLMWASTNAISGTTKFGTDVGWSCHPMEHELSAYYDITHGVGLAILTPRWMNHVQSPETAWSDPACFLCTAWVISPLGSCDQVDPSGQQRRSSTEEQEEDMDIRWIPLVGKTGYILAAGALIPTYILNDREIVLVDSGMHYDPGLVSFIRAVDVSVYAVLQTHLHEDHVANNRILISRFGTRIIAHRNEVEAVHSRQKIRASWSEIRPETKDKYLRTYSYGIESIENGQEEIVLRDVAFKIVPLYGHSEGHLGFVTPDGVLCTGDAILSPALVQHSKMPYFEDIGQSIDSMKKLLQTDYPYYALAHMEVLEKRDMPGLVKKNLALLERIHVDMLELINDPVTLDELVVSVMYGLGIRFRDETRNGYLKNTITQRVRYLVETGRMFEVEEDGVIRYGKT